MQPEDRLRTLVDERDIERTLIDFARAMDDRNWAAMASILAVDARGDLGTGPLAGGQEIIDVIRGFLDVCGTTQHLLGNLIVDVSGDSAVSRCYVRDVHLDAHDDPSMRFYTIGDYHDSWRRCTDGSWSLVERIKKNRGHVGSLQVFEG